MNISSLRAFNKNREDALNLLKWLAQADGGGNSSSDLLSLESLARVSSEAILISSYLSFCQNSWGLGSDAQPLLEISADLAVAEKICRGLHSAHNRWCALGLDPFAHLSPEEFYTFADEHATMIGQTEVCAGSPSQILEVLQVFSGPESRRPAELSEAALRYFDARFPSFVSHARACITIALLFETMRCFVWRHIAQPQGVNEPRSRYTMAGSRYAFELSASENPVSGMYSAHAEMLARCYGLANVNPVVSVAAELVALKDDQCRLLAKWNEFSSDAIRQIDNHNREIAILFPSETWRSHFGVREANVFFGTFPPRSSPPTSH